MRRFGRDEPSRRPGRRSAGPSPATCPPRVPGARRATATGWACRGRPRRRGAGCAPHRRPDPGGRSACATVPAAAIGPYGSAAFTSSSRPASGPGFSPPVSASTVAGRRRSAASSAASSAGPLFDFPEKTTSQTTTWPRPPRADRRGARPELEATGTAARRRSQTAGRCRRRRPAGWCARTGTRVRGASANSGELRRRRGRSRRRPSRRSSPRARRRPVEAHDGASWRSRAVGSGVPRPPRAYPALTEGTGRGRATGSRTPDRSSCTPVPSRVSTRERSTYRGACWARAHAPVAVAVSSGPAGVVGYSVPQGGGTLTSLARVIAGTVMAPCC